MKVVDGMVFRSEAARLEVRGECYWLDGRKLSLTTSDKPPHVMNNYSTVEGVEAIGWKWDHNQGWKTFYKSI